MRAVLLAAGLGSRLGPLTRDIPKACVEVAGEALVNRAVRLARLAGVEEVVVIGGYHSERTWAALRDTGARRLENPDFRMGNLYTLAKARDALSGGFVLMNVDHLYPSHLARMLSERPEGIWAVCDFDRPLSHDDMKVRVRGTLPVSAEVTAISKGLEEYDGGYCGLTVVNGEGVPRYLAALDAVLGHGREQAVVEDVLAHLIHQGTPPSVLDISGIRWLEVDTPEDLGNAERILRMKPHFLD
jgi:choline kinase